MAGNLSKALDGVPLVDDGASRDVRYPLATRTQNQRVFRLDNKTVERWDGSAWVVDPIDYANIANAPGVDAAFANNSITTTGLTYGYNAGVAAGSGGFARIAAGTVTLANNAVNYVERTYTGTVSRNTTGFTATKIPMSKVTTVAGAITVIEDWRTPPAPSQPFIDNAAFGQDVTTTTGLTYGYTAGTSVVEGVFTKIAAGTVTLPNASTNYVERTYAGVVSSNTTGFTSTNIPLAMATTSGGQITDVVDFRSQVAPPVPFPLLVGELGVVDTSYPVGHFHRYGAVGDGTTNDLVALNATIAAAPTGTVIGGNPSATYAINAPPTFTRGVTMSGQGATLKALASMQALAVTTDLSGMVWENWNVDGNNVAQNAIMSVATTVGPAAITMLNCHARNLATDHTLLNGGFRVTSTDITKRHRYVTIDNCSCKDSGVSGAYIYHTDDAKLTNWTGYNLDNHSFEFAFCKDFIADTIVSSYCGGSGAAAGAQCYHGLMTNIVANYCQGDAGITVENTSADIRVSNFMLRNCWKAGLSANFGESGHPFPNDVMRGIRYTNGTARAAVPVTITGATKANPCKLTIPSHGIKTIYLSNTVQVSISGVVGMTQLNGTTPSITTLNPGTGVHDPNAVWLTGVNSSAYGTYSSGGTMAPFCNGANLYGGVPAVSPNIGLMDVEFNDFNCGLAMLYMDGPECKDVRVNGLQGPLSAVARFTYCVNLETEGIACTDASHQPTDPLGAFQFLNQTGTSNACNHVRAAGLNCLQVGPTSNYPLIYIEGSGDYTFNNPTTGGASCVFSTRAAADTATIRVNSPSVSLSTTTPYVLGAASTPAIVFDYPTIPRTIGAANGTATYYDGTLRMSSASGSVALTLPLGASMVGKRITVVRTDATGNTVTLSATAPDTLASATLKGAKADQAFTVEAWSGGWNVVSGNVFPPAPATVNAAATDLPTVIALANQLRAVLISLEEAV